MYHFYLCYCDHHVGMGVQLSHLVISELLISHHSYPNHQIFTSYLIIRSKHFRDQWRVLTVIPFHQWLRLPPLIFHFSVIFARFMEEKFAHFSVADLLKQNIFPSLPYQSGVAEVLEISLFISSRNFIFLLFSYDIYFIKGMIVPHIFVKTYGAIGRSVYVKNAVTN